jgi:hypothetical protein
MGKKRMTKILPPFFGLMLISFLLCSCPAVPEPDDLGIEVESAKIISECDISGYPLTGNTGSDIAVNAGLYGTGQVYVRQDNILYQFSYYNTNQGKKIYRDRIEGFSPPRGTHFLGGSGMAVLSGMFMIPCYKDENYIDSFLLTDYLGVYYRQITLEEMGIIILPQDGMTKLYLGRKSSDDTLWVWFSTSSGKEIYATYSLIPNSTALNREDRFRFEKVSEESLAQPFDCASVVVSGMDVWYSRRVRYFPEVYYERFIWKSDLLDISTEIKKIKITSEKEIISSAVVVPIAYENLLLWVVVGDKLLCLEPR